VFDLWIVVASIWMTACANGFAPRLWGVGVLVWVVVRCNANFLFVMPACALLWVCVGDSFFGFVL
jgi:hypothetical protein